MLLFNLNHHHYLLKLKKKKRRKNIDLPESIHCIFIEFCLKIFVILTDIFWNHGSFDHRLLSNSSMMLDELRKNILMWHWNLRQHQLIGKIIKKKNETIEILNVRKKRSKTIFWVECRCSKCLFTSLATIKLDHQSNRRNSASIKHQLVKILHRKYWISQISIFCLNIL